MEKLVLFDKTNYIVMEVTSNFLIYLSCVHTIDSGY